MINKLIKYIKHPEYFLIKLDMKRIITLKDDFYLKMSYQRLKGEKLDLDKPSTFNEKLQWLKLNDRKDIYTTMVDKYEVKRYVSNIISEEYIIPTIGIYEKFDEIDFNKLPNKFVIKCTHDSGSTIICKNKLELNIEEVRVKINKSLKYNYYYAGREWPYKNVKPRIIIEQYMIDESNYELKDYKIFCFNGEPKMIQVDYDRYTNHKRNIYDTNWKLQEIEIQYPRDENKVISKPINLNEMLEIAKKLSKEIPFVRIDLYNSNGRIYFGEITFYHGSGTEKFIPEKYNRIFGDMIKLPETGKKKNNEK